MAKNDRHVVKNPQGGWDVKAPGAKRASAKEETQSAAEKTAKRIVGNAGGGEVIIHAAATAASATRTLSRRGTIRTRRRTPSTDGPSDARLDRKLRGLGEPRASGVPELMALTPSEKDRLIAVLLNKMCGPCRRGEADAGHESCVEAKR